MRRTALFVCMLAALLCAAEPSTHSGTGATVYDGGTSFRVWAPNAASVSVAGSFNGWDMGANPLASENYGWWSVDVPGAAAGDTYRFVINGANWRTDPRAKKVESSVGAGFITTNTFSWAPFSAPAWNDMVIYELHFGTYNDTGDGVGTYNSATAMIDHIAELGANAVEIMPTAEFPGDYSMGYNPVNIFAPETAYGKPRELRVFVDECHKRGIAVIIDVVYNHWGPSDLGESIWQFDGYGAASDLGGIYFFEDDNRYTPWGNTRPNYTTGEVRQYIRDNVMYWLTEYNMDGIRMDGTAFIRERDYEGTQVPGGWSLLQWLNDEINANCPQKICIAEDMRDNEWMTKTTGEGGAGFDSQWDAGFHHKVVPAVETLNDSDRNMWDISDAISSLYNGWDTQRIIYTESHDEVGASSGKARVPSNIYWDDPDSWYSKKRSTLGAAVALMSPGVPMLFMGQEFLESGSWHDDVPLDWTKDTGFSGIKLMYKHMIGMRRNLYGETNGLKGKNVNVFHVNNTDKVVAFHRWWNGGLGDDVIVVMNFANRGYTEYNIGMPKSGRWRVRFNSDWNGYDSTFSNWNAYDTQAWSGGKDGLAYNANIGLGPYSVVVLSQGTTPDIDFSGTVDNVDMSLLAGRWLNSCDSWDACGGADFDISGAVDINDLYRFLDEWLR